MTSKLINQLKRIADAPVASLVATDLVPVQLANGETRAVTIAQLLALNSAGAGTNLMSANGTFAASTAFANGAATWFANLLPGPPAVDPSLTLTAPRKVRIEISMTLASSTNAANARLYAGVQIDGTTTLYDIWPVPANSASHFSRATVRTSLAAGTHTFRPGAPYWDGGVGTLTVQSGWPWSINIVDEGPA